MLYASFNYILYCARKLYSNFESNIHVELKLQQLTRTDSYKSLIHKAGKQNKTAFIPFHDAPLFFCSNCVTFLKCFLYLLKIIFNYAELSFICMRKDFFMCYINSFLHWNATNKLLNYLIKYLYTYIRFSARQNYEAF